MPTDSEAALRAEVEQLREDKLHLLATLVSVAGMARDVARMAAAVVQHVPPERASELVVQITHIREFAEARAETNWQQAVEEAERWLMNAKSRSG